MAGPIKKVGPFTQTRAANRPTMADAWVGMGHDWYKEAGAMQHHDRVLRREAMGQKMTPKAPPANKGKKRK